MIPLRASITTHPTTYLHNNASYHKSEKTMNFIEENQLDVDQLSPLSPDFNIIERIWWIVEYRANERRPRTLQELQDIIAEEWMNILQEEVEKCILDLQATLRAVIAAEG